MDDSIHFTRAQKMGTGVNGTYLMNARPPTHTRPQTRKRQGAWSVDAGRSQRLGLLEARCVGNGFDGVLFANLQGGPSGRCSRLGQAAGASNSDSANVERHRQREHQTQRHEKT